MSLMLLNVENRSLLGHHTRVPGHVRPFLTKQLKCQSLQRGSRQFLALPAGPLEFLMRHRSAADLRPEQPNGACTADWRSILRQFLFGRG